MKASKECYECCIRKAEGLLVQYEVKEPLCSDILNEVKETVRRVQEEDSAPELMTEITAVLEKYIQIGDAYAEPKRRYNQVLLEREEEIRRKIEGAKDPFLAGIQTAITGNYIDFGAMSDVNEEQLNRLLEQRNEIRLDPEELEHLRGELEQARKLVYLLDNAGEIVLDKMFMEILKKLYPKLRITAVVRGAPVLNDVTIEDAKETGLTDVVQVISNGTDIPGTPLEKISKEARQEICSADLCIAKGQGNFETLQGCGENVYYLFLCKCSLFVKRFGVEQFAPVLKNEKRMETYEV